MTSKPRKKRASGNRSPKPTASSPKRAGRPPKNTIGSGALRLADTPALAAVIDIGATSIRMAIAEIDHQGGVRPLDNLSQAVNLGKDTFTRGSITRRSIEDCVRVLKSYREKLEEYGIEQREQIRVVATSAVREAANRLAFSDRVYIATGLEVEDLDESEVNRITYLGVQPLLKGALQLEPSSSEPSASPLAPFGGQLLVVEVGGGSTELLLIAGGKVAFSHTYRIGSLRLPKTLEAYQAPSAEVRRMMDNYVRRIEEDVHEHRSPDQQMEMIALGGDMRFAAAQMLPEAERGSLPTIGTAKLGKFTEKVFALSVDEIVRRYHLSYPDAETAGPALLAYTLLAQAFSLERVIVSYATLRDGLFQEMAIRETWTAEFSEQIILSALDLGRKYDFDEPHALHVAGLSKALFHDLRETHRLEPRYELLLYLAALLHEIGQFISQRGYHKHSMYVIRNSELFGMGRRDLHLVALTARYHRRRSPHPSHELFAALDREQRVAVAKMAALLRLAVALDESRSQRIHTFRCAQERGRLVLSIPDVDDLTVEQIALRQSGALFEETFGIPVLLRKGKA